MFRNGKKFIVIFLIYSSADNDPHLCDFIESKFLEEQIESIYELNKIISNIKQYG